MGFSIVKYLVTHAWLEDKIAAIFQFRVQFALQAKPYVTFAAPMVCDIARCVVDHANRDGADMLRAPVRHVTTGASTAEPANLIFLTKFSFPN